MLATLRQHDFALLWLAGLISLTGDRAMLTALPFYVYGQTGSTLATATMFAAYYLPMVLLGSVAGVFVDRWDRKRIMVVTSLLQTAATSLLLLVRPGEWLWLVYLVVFVEIAAGMFFGPAENALLPHLVQEDHLLSANALNALNNNIARLAGPPLGGALFGLFGLGSVALVDSASFLIAGLLISLISVSSKPRRRRAGATDAVVSSWVGAWREWLEGLRLVRGDRPIAALFVVLTVTSFGGAIIDPLYAPFVHSVLHGGAVALGWFSTAGAVGGLLGGLIVGRFGRRAQPRQLVGCGTAAAGVLMLVLYNQTSLPAALVLGALLFVPIVASGVGAQTLLQTGVPDRYRGRVSGALNTTVALIGLVALGLAGVLGELWGIVPLLSVAGGITLLAGVLALVLLPKGQPGREPAEGEERETPVAP